MRGLRESVGVAITEIDVEVLEVLGTEVLVDAVEDLGVVTEKNEDEDEYFVIPILELLIVEDFDVVLILEELLVELVVSKGAQIAPKAEASLKSSEKAPLETPNFVPLVEAISEVALYRS